MTQAAGPAWPGDQLYLSDPNPVPIQVAQAAPYFVTTAGMPWTPIGHNEAVCWPHLASCYQRADLPQVEAYLSGLVHSGVTCVRLMLEYCEEDEFFLEGPTGHFRPDDDPRNTVDAACSTGQLVRAALAAIQDQRPFLDSEHGPIHAFKDHELTLPEPFDDEYFRHLQWAHLASGGVGGGMRWPNREPHRLTPGMHAAQSALARFLPLIDWLAFRRRNLNDELAIDNRAVKGFACGDATQAVVWLLRTDRLRDDGRLDAEVPGVPVRVGVPGLQPGRFEVVAWDTRLGQPLARWVVEHSGGDWLYVQPPDLRTDLALAIRPDG